MLKTVMLIVSVCLLAMPAYADEIDTLTLESRAVVKQYFSQLKGQLKTTMKSGGPVKAIEVCKTAAPAIADSLSKQYQGKVARTSLKYRNNSNKPDAWESKTLQEFERRKAEGSPIKALEVSEIVETDGKRVFRYMKAIPTGDICLKCHGKAIDSSVMTKLDDLYPEDKARGFIKGDIRGAFTLVKELN